jgi:hypothetical protein
MHAVRRIIRTNGIHRRTLRKLGQVQHLRWYLRDKPQDAPSCVGKPTMPAPERIYRTGHGILGKSL